jgi:hypothetical protein
MVPRVLFGPAVPANRPALLQTGREKVASSCDLLPPSFLRIPGRRPGFPSALHRDAECAQGRYIGIRYPLCRRSRERTSTVSRKPHGFSGGPPSVSVRCSTPANYRGSTRARTRTHRGRFTESRSTHAGTRAEARARGPATDSSLKHPTPPGPPSALLQARGIGPGLNRTSQVRLSEKFATPNYAYATA